MIIDSLERIRCGMELVGRVIEEALRHMAQSIVHLRFEGISHAACIIEARQPNGLNAEVAWLKGLPTKERIEVEKSVNVALLEEVGQIDFIEAIQFVRRIFM